MASDCYRKTRLLPFVGSSDEAAAANNNNSPLMSIHNKGSGSSASSWSDLSSELGSTETGSDDDKNHNDVDGDDFISQLSRQMADYMLGEEEEEEEDDDDGKGGTGCASNNLEVYKLEDQPSPKDSSGYYSRVGGRVKWSELTQPANQEVHKPVVQYQMHVQQNKNNNNNNNKGKGWPPHEQRRQKPKQQRFPVAGLGMKAVFLGENGSKSASSGTGVFLPRGTGNLTEVTPKKRGCSTVLIPARVLQTLQVHFQDMNKRSQSIASSHSSNVNCTSHQLEDGNVATMQSSETDGCKEFHIHPNTASDDTMSDNQCTGLPPEWTY